MRSKISFLLFFILLTLGNASAAFNFASGVTVSGLSAGAYMAGQLHVAYSDTFQGAAILAGGPYACARGSLVTALMQCMDVYQGAPDGQRLYQNAQELERHGEIDSLSNLKDDKVFLLSGLRDRTVAQSVVKANLGFYSMLPRDAIRFVDDMAVGHAFPTVDRGNACDLRSESPWVSACNRDIAGELLQHLLGKLKPKTQADDSAFYRYRQESTPSMAEQGIAYVPRNCLNGQPCRLHVSLHGCHQVEEELGDIYVKEVGLNEWAEANNIVILYPQAVKDQLLGNPNGCWDWWGYTGRDYATKNGAQMLTVKHAVDAFLHNKVQLQAY